MSEEEVKEALVKIGVTIHQCEKCGRDFFWINTKNGRNAPVTMELKNHFIDCLFAETFKK